MRYSLAICFVFASLATSHSIARDRSADDCVSSNLQCSPTTACENQKRGSMKHRMPSVVSDVTPISVQTILDWEPPAGLEKASLRNSQTPIDDHEKKLFSLEADVWLAKRAPDDCDVHMEISAPGGTMNDPRVIAEIPSDDYFDVFRKLIQDKLAELKRRGHSGVKSRCVYLVLCSALRQDYATELQPEPL